jgi:hypothetical protein
LKKRQKGFPVNVPVQMLVRIDPPIAALYEVEGKKLNIKLGNTRAKICFPFNGPLSGVSSSNLATWPTFPGTRVPYVLTPIEAGVPVSLTLIPQPKQFDFDAIMFLVSGNPAELTTHQDVIDLTALLGEWITTFRAWIRLWTRAPQVPIIRSLHPAVRVAYRMDDTWRRFHLPGESRVYIFGTTLASSQMIDAAAAAASARIEPQPEQSMLARAGDHYLNQDTRRAVIDSCTAAEMALGRAVRNHLLARSVDKSVIDSILKRANGIVEVFRLHMVAADSAISLKKVIDQLAGPRNDAAHDGLAPSTLVAKKALETAGQMLHEVSPLEDPHLLIKRVRRELRVSSTVSS